MTGRYQIAGGGPEPVRAFVPHPLRPVSRWCRPDHRARPFGRPHAAGVCLCGVSRGPRGRDGAAL